MFVHKNTVQASKKECTIELLTRKISYNVFPIKLGKYTNRTEKYN